MAFDVGMSTIPSDFSRFVVDSDWRPGGRVRSSKAKPMPGKTRVVKAVSARPTKTKTTSRNWIKPLVRVIWFLILCAVASALVYGARWALEPTTLPIQSVRVEGALKHIDRAQITNEVAPYASGGFFSVNVDDVHRSLIELPWIEHAAVKRVWPDSIHVRVTEREPVARWGNGGLVTADALVFQPDSKTIPVGLPALLGPDGQQRVMLDWYNQASTLLQPIGMRIAELKYSNRRAWILTTDKGLELNIGRADAVQRLERFVKLYPKTLAQQIDRVAAVDLRHPNGFSVAWKPEVVSPVQPAAGEKH